MIKINNKTTLITLTIVACLAFLAQPVQAYDKRVFPQNLQGLPTNVNSYRFSWVNVNAQEGGIYKALIVVPEEAGLPEYRNVDPEQFTLRPYNHTIFYNGSLRQGQTYFQLRDYNSDGNIVKMVTIQDELPQGSMLLYRKIPFSREVKPINFVGTANFNNVVNQETRFQMKRRVQMRNGFFYVPLTLE